MEKPESVYCVQAVVSTCVIVVGQGDVGLQIEFDKHRSHLGAMVSSIKPGSPADKAGNIYIGDVIVGELYLLLLFNFTFNLHFPF